MKIIDTHSHFKDKFLKVMTKKELKCYFDSGVESVIGVIDFFKVHWEDVGEEISAGIHQQLVRKHRVDLSQQVIKNILKEEIYYAHDRILDRFTVKLNEKIFSHSGKNIKTLAKDVKKICDAALPPDPVERFLKNIREEIAAAKKIESLYGRKTFLGIGIHPLAISHIGTYENCVRLIKGIEKLIRSEKRVIAIGECGLDNNTQLERDVFRQMVRLGKKLKLPLIMHTPMTGGSIPSERKCKGIREMSRILIEEGVDPKLCVFDHITDHTCLDILASKYSAHRPYVSFSIQKHWLKPQQFADIVAEVDSSWHDLIMVNCDFGTYQTPDAFVTIKDLFRKKKVPLAVQQKVFFDNPVEAFDLPLQKD